MFWAYPLASLFLARVALSSAVTPANVFTGCQTVLPGTLTNLTSSSITTATQCNTACAKVTPAVAHSNWQASTQNCICSPKYSPPPNNDFGNADMCASSADWDSRLTTTSYTLIGCYANPPAGLTSVAKTGPNGCLSSCTQQTQAGFYIGSDSTNYGCTCGPGTYTTQTQCGPKAYFVYQRSQADASAGIARRKRQERYDREQQKFVPCPMSMTPCIIPGFSEDTYECVDTQSDLESCGGCVAGTYHSPNSTIGQDCSDGAALGYSTCNNGKCFINRCKRGYQLVNGKCVR